ncbi:unnamed protein product [Rhizoctonia solani]|uniref:Uncharacterized protein n=1 Tax=Rhizoctonia solani TaxID=456999 RepID=A0A8H3HRN4_9AGAM|nr:unnamed protein product [Rhizoctonia solani]
MFFRRALAFVTVASLALLSHARPAHHARAVAVAAAAGTTTPVDATTFISNINLFQKDIEACSDDISKAASTGKDPEEKMKELNGIFTAFKFPASVKLTPEQEKECAEIVTVSLTKSIKACHDVAAKHNFMKYYAKWTETDFAMHSFMQKLASLSFSLYKQSLVDAGKPSAGRLHDMKMRHMENDFRGMGISYE